MGVCGTIYSPPMACLFCFFPPMIETGAALSAAHFYHVGGGGVKEALPAFDIFFPNVIEQPPLLSFWNKKRKSRHCCSQLYATVPCPPLRSNCSDIITLQQPYPGQQAFAVFPGCKGAMIASERKKGNRLPSANWAKKCLFKWCFIFSGGEQLLNINRPYSVNPSTNLD